MELIQYSLCNFFDEIRSIDDNIMLAIILSLLFILLLSTVYYIHERKTMRRIKELAYNDNLCKIRNRNGLIRDGSNNQKYKTIICFDVNNFRNLNLSNGYDFGDKLLINIAKTMGNSMSENDIFARVKDDTFALLSHVTDVEELGKLVNDFIKKINSMYVYFLKITFSVGICTREDEPNIAKILDEANIARIASKKSGRSQIMFFDDLMVEEIDREIEMCSDLRYALLQNEFVVYYQPKFDVKNRTIVGSEALVRWTRKGRSISPAVFIPVAEKRQLVVDIDRIVFEQVCKDIKRCILTEKKVYPVSINFSKADLYSVDMLDFLEHMQKKYQIPVEYIEIEITETQCGEDMDVLRLVVAKLKSMGFKVSLDDFGSGYSSISFLESMPVDIIKIDRSLLINMESSEKSKIILQQIVSLSKNIGLTVVCEGVESEEQVRYLAEIGCDYGQGFIFSRPIDFNTYLRTYCQ